MATRLFMTPTYTTPCCWCWLTELKNMSSYLLTQQRHVNLIGDIYIYIVQQLDEMLGSVLITQPVYLHLKLCIIDNVEWCMWLTCTWFNIYIMIIALLSRSDWSCTYIHYTYLYCIIIYYHSVRCARECHIPYNYILYILMHDVSVIATHACHNTN